MLSVGKAKGDPTPALVTNLDSFESSVENRIRERSEQRREEREAAKHGAIEHEVAAQANQEVAPAEAAEAVEVREEEPTESQPIVDRAPGRTSVLPSRPRSGRAPSPAPTHAR